jgi:hypothetical protein
MVLPHRASADAEALLPFRYIDGILLRKSFSPPRSAVVRDEVMAGGTPANPAALEV